jgi:hypothetical protein
MRILFLLILPILFISGCGEDPNLDSNSETSLSRKINEGEVVKNLNGELEGLEFVDDLETEIPTKKIKQDPLYNDFKAYVTANPSLRMAEFDDYDYERYRDFSDYYERWVFDRGLDFGLNRDNSLFIVGEYGEDFFSTTLHALQQFFEGVFNVEVNENYKLTEFHQALEISKKVEGNYFGIGFSITESSVQEIQTKEDIYSSNTVVNIREASFSISQNSDIMESNFIDNGLSAFDFLKYLHHHECISFRVFRNSEGYGVIFYMILKNDGNGGPKYKRSNVRKSSLNIKGGNLESGVVFKPNGEQCPISKVENGNGVLVHYNFDGQEIRRRKYVNGQPLLD